MPPKRLWCTVVGCNGEHSSRHVLPTSEPLRTQWLNFIFKADVPADLPKTVNVCANHFSLDCFINAGQYKAGFATKLLLKNGAVPTLRVPASSSSGSINNTHAPTGGEDAVKKEEEETTIKSEAPDPQAVSDVPALKPWEEAVPCLPTRTMACQTHPPVRHTRGTQLSLRTLGPHFKSAAVQATLCFHNLSNDESTNALELSLFPPTTAKSLTKRATKRARTKAIKNVRKTPEGSNILQSREVLVSTQCLLELFQFCWPCQVKCDFTIEGNEKLFSVKQYCPSCDHHRDWSSQPRSGEPAGNENHETQHELMSEEGEIVVQIASSDNEGSDHMFNEDGLYLSSNDEEASSEEEKVRKKRKRKSKGGDSSDDWEPHLEEQITDSDELTDEDQEEDGQRKLVVWCTECEGEATRSCSAHRHKKTFCCARCGSGDAVQTHTLETLPVRFDNFDTFQIHAEQEHGTKSFYQLCPDCGKLHTAKKEHVCEHKTKFIVCPECGKRFLSEGGLKIHYGQLHSDFDHPCKYCLKVFKTRPAKLEHEQTHHKDNEPYSCPDCPLNFDNIHERNKHVRSHRGPRKYECDVCKKGFKGLNQLNRHKLIHSGEKPFRCQVCERSFNQMENLTSHMRVHTGEKPFMCELCGESFSHNVSLKNHKQRHHEAGLTHEEDDDEEEEEETMNDLE
ncbi:uncharacterized protein LOC128513118 isoform X2 [Clarias gariepinus]|uniref:uncharacterized protein LOC128513118 isoform X2 n=1 Tax=Clarias gariepinus TaxID=13013 RepID=UPI00234C5C68|nr:uncharacterized protein LOC128513118 isoform X2 [Clarias gariepinus]